MTQNTQQAPGNGEIEEIEAKLALYGFRMEPSLAAFSGDGHAIVDIATDELYEAVPPIQVLLLAEQWSRLLTPTLFVDDLSSPSGDEPAPKNLRSVGAAARALEAHRTALRIDGNAELQVWHLIVSLTHWCNARNVDIVNVFAEAHEAAQSEIG